MKEDIRRIEPVAYIQSDFPEKFGIPRQSGLARTRARIVFSAPYNTAEALRGLEDFSHIWLIWDFSANRSSRTKAPADAHGQKAPSWHATVRPPRLGGNTRIGVFASRSPFRPNGLGLSCVRLLQIDTSDGAAPALIIEGADLMDGTPIYDIKPYIPYADSHPEASGGFTDQVPSGTLRVEIPQPLLAVIPKEKQEGLLDLLSQDPRPSYQHDPSRIYGLSYAGYNIKFYADEQTLTVVEITPVTSVHV